METKNLPYSRAGNGYGINNGIYHNPYGAHPQTSQGYNVQQTNTDMGSLAHGFHGMNVATPYNSHRKGHYVNPGHGHFYGPLMANGLSTMYGPSGHYNFPYNPPGAPTGPVFAQHSVPCSAPVTYHPYMAQEHSPASQAWISAEIPTLITPRRDSTSSAENEQPGTPSYGGPTGLGVGGVVIARSPSGLYAQSTPSPRSMLGHYGERFTGDYEPNDISEELKQLVAQSPAIPRAIPAPSSPLKPLDRALENQRGVTNVYIRGLLPETMDTDLIAWCSRFGEIISSKSIIDAVTGLCKGYGFVKYHSYEEANDCIRGFHYLGYEVSFARESFNYKLKQYGDDKNTNLYVSNLPKTMNEHELAKLFAPHKVFSTRILRDHKSGHGRGVGFARFDTRETCEQIIAEFNDKEIKISDEEQLRIQIRYADTQDQKLLKQRTQAARQFRSLEYEQATQRLRGISGDSSGDTSQLIQGPAAFNEFEHFLSNQAGEISRDRQRSPSLDGSVQRHDSTQMCCAPSTDKDVRFESIIVSSTPVNDTSKTTDTAASLE